MTLDLKTLAQDFLDVTVNKWGTDEETANAIAKTVHDQGLNIAFEQEIRNLGYEENVRQIFETEFSTAERNRIEDLYWKGEETWRASNLDYFKAGIQQNFDLSSTTSKIMMVAGTTMYAGLLAASAPTALFVGSALVVGTAVYSGIAALKNGLEIYFSKTEGEAKQNYQDLGANAGTFLLTALPLTRSFRRVRTASKQHRVLYHNLRHTYGAKQQPDRMEEFSRRLFQLDMQAHVEESLLEGEAVGVIKKLINIVSDETRLQLQMEMRETHIIAQLDLFHGPENAISRTGSIPYSALENHYSRRVLQAANTNKIFELIQPHIPDFEIIIGTFLKSIKQLAA